MTYLKYIIVPVVVLFSSCDNNSADVAAISAPVDKSIDSVGKRDNQLAMDTALNTTWANFRKAVETNNTDAFQQLSLDSLESCDTVYSVTKFISKCFREVFDTTLIGKLVETRDMTPIDETIEPEYLAGYALKKADYNGGVITLKQLQIVKELTPDGAWTMTFDFIKTKQGYKFFGCDSYGGPVCCH